MRKPLIIPNQIPEFLRTEYPAFVEFLQLYYEWLEQQQIGSIESLVDIDKTVDDFIQYFRKEFDVNGIEYEFISPRLFLRKSKELFTAKGSEAAIKFLFRILYGKESDVITPWNYVLIPSEGKWFQDITVFAQITLGDGQDLTSQRISFTGTDGRGYSTFVRAAAKITDNVYQLYLDQFNTSYVTYDVTFANEANNIRGTILRTTTNVKVVDGGYDFEVGQLFTIDGFSGNGTIVKVKSVNSQGTITAVEVIQFGLGYNTNFTTQIYPKDSINTQKVSQITLEYDQDDDSSLDLVATYITNDKLNNPSEALLFTRHNYTGTAGLFWTINANEIVAGAQYKIVTVGSTDYTEFGAPDNNIGTVFTATDSGSGSGTVETLRSFFVDSTYVGEIVGETQVQQGYPIVTRLGAATLFLQTGGIAKYPGYYLDGESLISDLSYIQDSYRYQKFSYVTAIEEELETYKEILKKTLHPIGTQLLGEYRAVNNFTQNIVIDPQINLLPRGTFIESVIASDQIPQFNIGKNVSETVVTDAYITAFEVGKALTDSAVVSETTAKHVDKALTDSAVTSEATQFDVDKALTDSALISDATQFDVDKALTDSALISDTVSNNVTKPLTDSVANTDATAITTNKYITDSVVVTDQITDAEFSGERIVYQTVNTSDNAAITTDKYLTDTANTSNAGGLFVGPLYYDVTEAQYWAAGYLENETAITN